MPDKNQNLIPFAIGFLLILLVGFITFLKLDFPEKKKTEETALIQGLPDEFKKTRQIENSELAKKIHQRNDATVIDTRNEESYKTDHILDSQNIPLASLGVSLAAYNKESSYVIVDYDGSSQSIVQIESIVRELGFSHVLYLHGGFSGWKAKFYPTVAEGDPASFADQSKVTYVSSDELKNMMEQSSNLLIIDVRKSNQFQQGHLKGAINIFLDELEKRRGEITPGKKIVLYDNDGLWAFKAAVRLFDMSFLDILALSDGLDEWKGRGYEITN